LAEGSAQLRWSARSCSRLGVGVSRIYLGYHYLTDLVGGLMAGIAWLLVVGAAFNARPGWWHWGDGSSSADRPAT
jgi:hypothetical protein